MACQFQSIASTSPFLIKAFSIDFARLGTLVGLYMLLGIFIALPGGLLAQRFGTKNLALAGLLLMVVGGVLMGFGSSYEVVAAGRVISGVGAVLINVLATKMAADWFAGREIISAMAFLVISWPLGIALGLLLFAPLAESLSWNAVMYLTALMAALSFLLMLLVYRNPPEATAIKGSHIRLELDV